ncbi:MAG: DUF1992 domain-containing protein [Ramlibacter sp.]
MATAPEPRSLRTMDEEIAHRLAEAAASGELQSAESYGKPLKQAQGWDETPEALRMPFKILKDSGFTPPEIELFHERARLRESLATVTDASERELVQRALSQLEQRLSLRLEALRNNARL